MHLQAESTGPLGTLQDEQTRLKAEYDRMEVLSSHLLVSGLSGGTKQSLEWPAFPLMAAHDDQRLLACMTKLIMHKLIRYNQMRSSSRHCLTSCQAEPA